MKAKQFDKYAVIATIMVLTFAMLLANVIKDLPPINLFAVHIGLFLAYSGTRDLVVSRR